MWESEISHDLGRTDNTCCSLKYSSFSGLSFSHSPTSHVSYPVSPVPPTARPAAVATLRNWWRIVGVPPNNMGPETLRSMPPSSINALNRCWVSRHQPAGFIATSYGHLGWEQTASGHAGFPVIQSGTKRGGFEVVAPKGGD